MSEVDLRKKLLDAQPELTLEECIKLAEAVVPGNWEKVSSKDKFHKSYQSNFENLRLNIGEESGSNMHEFYFLLEINSGDNIVARHLEHYTDSDRELSGEIAKLYDRVEKRDVNESVINIRDYLGSLNNNCK